PPFAKGCVMRYVRPGCGVALAMTLVSAASAQTPPEKAWTRFYTGPAGFFNNVKGGTTDAQGDVYTTGGSATGTGSAMATVKYAPDGTELWSARYVNLPTGSDRSFVVRVAPDGNPIIAGISDGQGTFGDYLVIKYNAATGAEIWRTRYDGP